MRIGPIVIFFLLGGAIFLGASFALIHPREGEWVCTNGAWVMHGSTAAAQPLTPCENMAEVPFTPCAEIQDEQACNLREDCLPVNSCPCATDQERSRRCGAVSTIVCDCTMNSFLRCAPLNCLEHAADANLALSIVSELFPTKIVYISGVDLATLEQDCTVRGGVFSTCGTPCEPNAAVCQDVCAYTCSAIPE